MSRISYCGLVVDLQHRHRYTNYTYAEHVNDLIEPHNKNVSVRLIRDVVMIEPLTKMKFTSAPAVMEFIRRGNGNRRVTATAMNPESSRSHSVFQLELRIMDSDGTLVSHPTLILADLAGSEDPRKSGVKGTLLMLLNNAHTHT